MRSLFKNGDPSLQGFAFKSDREANLRFRELRDEAVAERCEHRGVQRSLPGPPSSRQLVRWHIGWKRSNKLIESDSLVQSSGTHSRLMA
jgi:hypothetical protein